RGDRRPPAVTSRRPCAPPCDKPLTFLHGTPIMAVSPEPGRHRHATPRLLVYPGQQPPTGQRPIPPPAGRGRRPLGPPAPRPARPLPHPARPGEIRLPGRAPQDPRPPRPGRLPQTGGGRAGAARLLPRHREPRPPEPGTYSAGLAAGPE